MQAIPPHIKEAVLKPLQANRQGNGRDALTIWRFIPRDWKAPVIDAVVTSCDEPALPQHRQFAKCYDQVLLPDDEIFEVMMELQNAFSRNKDDIPSILQRLSAEWKQERESLYEKARRAYELPDLIEELENARLMHSQFAVAIEKVIAELRMPVEEVSDIGK